MWQVKQNLVFSNLFQPASTIIYKNEMCFHNIIKAPFLIVNDGTYWLKEIWKTNFFVCASFCSICNKINIFNLVHILS